MSRIFDEYLDEFDNITKWTEVCPCGKGTIEHEKDETPGYRCRFKQINCEVCKKNQNK